MDHKKYIEEISKKLDRLNQINGVNPSQNKMTQHTKTGGRGSIGDGFNDDTLNIMGNSSMNWMKKNQ
jgi:hypothetical protein